MNEFEKAILNQLEQQTQLMSQMAEGLTLLVHRETAALEPASPSPEPEPPKPDPKSCVCPVHPAVSLAQKSAWAQLSTWYIQKLIDGLAEDPTNADHVLAVVASEQKTLIQLLQDVYSGGFQRARNSGAESSDD